MRYAVHFIWNDDTKDSFDVDSASERDANIADMVRRNRAKSRASGQIWFKEIWYCPLYKNGEQGRRKTVKVL